LPSKGQLELFNRYFDQLAAQRGSFSVQDKLALQLELRTAAADEGTAPISLTQLARVQVSDPRLQAILNGQEVSLGGVMVGSVQATTRQRLVGMNNSSKLLMMLAIILLPILLFVGFLLIRGKGDSAPTVTPTVTQTRALLPTATLTPTPPFASTATPYALVLNNNDASVARGPTIRSRSSLVGWPSS